MQLFDYGQTFQKNIICREQCRKRQCKVFAKLCCNTGAFTEQFCPCCSLQVHFLQQVVGLNLVDWNFEQGQFPPQYFHQSCFYLMVSELVAHKLPYQTTWWRQCTAFDVYQSAKKEQEVVKNKEKKKNKLKWHNKYWRS